MKKQFYLTMSLKVGARTAAVILFAASLSTFTSCKKPAATDPGAAETATSVAPGSVPGQRTTGYVQGDKQLDSYGTVNGFFWSLYRENKNSTSAATLTNYNAGQFDLSYTNVQDVVGGKGWNPGSARSIGYNIGALSGRYDFVGIYGWTTSPLIEYYVAEKGSATGGTYVGNMTSDGHTYQFYKYQRVSAPSIIGTATFWQYKDTWGGAALATNGNVNMANHVNNWISHGGEGFGTYNYMILALEAADYTPGSGGKSGYINATVW